MQSKLGKSRRGKNAPSKLNHLTLEASHGQTVKDIDLILSHASSTDIVLLVPRFLPAAQPAGLREVRVLIFLSSCSWEALLSDLPLNVIRS